MRNFEKILITLVLLLFGIQLLPDFTGKEGLFGLATYILALSYLVGGYWLLNSKDNKKYFIPIVAGVAFATSLFVLPFAIRVRDDTFLKILPLLNVVLFIGLGIYLIIKRNAKDIVKQQKGIFIRSAVILIVVGFFSYTPVSFNSFRYIVIALNNGNNYLVSNMQMFNYIEKYEDALENDDCDRAIDNAKKANEAGLVWLGISPEEYEKSQQDAITIKKIESNSTVLPAERKNLGEKISSKSQLRKISGTFAYLFIAYKCKADEYYENSEYEAALNYYLKGDKALNACDHYYDHWYVQQAYSSNTIALCYQKLHNYKFADSLFVEAIEKYQDLKDTTDRNVAIFYSNLAESMAEQLHFGYSNQLLKESIEILQRDSANKKNKKEIIENYHSLIKNHLKTDSLEHAKLAIEETFKRVDNATVNLCNTKLYYGHYFYKLSKYKRADEVLTECLDCYRKLLEPTNQNIAEYQLVLAKVKIALAEYDLAKSNLDNGLAITTKNYGKNSYRYAYYLNTYAHLDKEIGNYEKSEQEYYHAIETYIRELGERNSRLPEALSGLADLELVLAKFKKAKAHSDSSISITNYFIDLETPAVTGLINNAAYVNYYVGLYELSDSLYKKTININRNYGLQSTASTAIALNGLGLLMAAKGKYKTADSLFAQTLKLHKEIFTENHPHTAVVYLNYANLKIAENKVKQARQMLTKSLDINKKFFDPEHDIFADIYIAYGALAEKEKQRGRARNYYQKALDIYIDKFDEGHVRVISTREKLKK